jgi:Tol biopolymer transport system component
MGIWMISIIGASLKKLREDAHDAALSPDGTQIVFRDAINQDMWLMNVDGGQAHLIFKREPGYHIFYPTWFTNGKRIFYGKYKITGGAINLILESRDLQGNNPALLLNNSRLSDFAGGQKARLIYAVRELPPHHADSNLWELKFDEETGKPNGPPRRLTDWTGFYFGNPTLTADGNSFVFLNQRAQSDVYLGELANGGNELKTPQRLTLDDRIDWPGGWSLDGKTLLFYSDRNGSFDIFRQGVSDRNPESVATGAEEKWAPQMSPDGKWILFMQWAKAAEGAPVPQGRLMRVPVSGGPSEAVMDISGKPWITYGSDPTNTIEGYPSFRCPKTGTTCVLAEADDKQITFTAVDPLQGRKAELAKLVANSDLAHWGLSSDGTRVAVGVFDYKAGDIQIIPLSGGTPQKISAMPWAEITAVAWASDDKSLFIGSFSSRGTSIVHLEFDGKSKSLFKPSWDIFSLSPSPDGHYLAFGPIVTNANAWTIASFPRK